MPPGAFLELLKVFRVSRLRLRDDTGQAALEFAIVAPVLLLITFSAISLSLLILARYNLDKTAREAARVGAEISIYPECAAYIQAVERAESKARRILEERGLDPDRLTFSVTSPGSGSYPRDGFFAVRLEYNYEMPFDPSGLLGFALGNDGVVPLSSEHSFAIQAFKARWPIHHPGC
ncbi:MAG: pilus assembly protein [Anaerolineales bacterium]|nr:pilus assembly protein [Anaerolineales bacterium]